MAVGAYYFEYDPATIRCHQAPALFAGRRSSRVGPGLSFDNLSSAVVSIFGQASYRFENHLTLGLRQTGTRRWPGENDADGLPSRS